jgi:two-component system, LytTR family, sensor kinase
MSRNQTRYFIEIVIHILFWSGVYYALKALTLSSFNVVVRHGSGITQRIDGRMLFPYAWLVLGFLVLLFYSNVFWLLKNLVRYRSNFSRVALITGWMILLFAVNYLLIHLLVGATLTNQYPPHEVGPGPPLPEGISLPRDRWSHMQTFVGLIFLCIQGIAVGYFFIKEWIRNELTRSQLEAHQLSIEVRFLRSQVNPHFLFNTLNNLFSMAQKKGNDELADGISKLSGMMRYMIYESNTDYVPLQKEIEYLKDCITLSKLRYADSEVSVSFHHQAQTEMANVQVAPMLFVPFLENAFKHGVSIGHTSTIAMALSVNQKKLTFTCENTDYSTVKKLEEEKSGIGLENIKRRLELVYPGRHELRAQPEGGKYRVTLQIDLV